MSNDVVVAPAGNGIVVELLNNDNYIKWSSLVRTYLIAQDLWDVVEPPPLTNISQIAQNFILGQVEKFPNEPRKPRETSNADGDNSSSAPKRPEDGRNKKSKASRKPKDSDDSDESSSEESSHDDHQADHHHDLPKQPHQEVGRGLIDHSPKPDQDQDGICDESAEPKDAGDHHHHHQDIKSLKKTKGDGLKFLLGWTKKNAGALHAIKSSCGSEALTVIILIERAQDAWKILEAKFKPQFLRNLQKLQEQPSHEIPPEYESFYKTIVSGDLSSAKAFLDKYPNAATERINPFKETALHVAAAYGHTHIVEELLNQMTNKDLEIQQDQGYTALSLAAMTGIIPMARCLVERNNALAGIASNGNELPVLMAISVGQFDMARYLYSRTKLDDLTKDNFLAGAPLLAQCILSKNFDIALDLIKQCPRLTIAETMNAIPSPIILAMCKFAFPSGSHLIFWQRWIYNCIKIPTNSATWSNTLTSNISGGSDSAASKDTRISVSGEPNKNFRTNARPREKKPIISSGFLRGIGSQLSNFLGIKKIYELRLLHVQSQEFLRCTMDNLRTLRSESRVLVTDLAYQAMFKAVEEGNIEIIIEVTKAIPELIRYLDHRGRNIFSYAVECRQAEIFNLIHGFVILKEQIAAVMDDSGNSVLHVAGKLAPPSHLSHISGAALQMQRELQWFQEVESIMQNKLVHKEYYKNAKNMTPREYFTENHKELAKEGEKWMKETAANCTFVSALIVTIMFASAFIVPGGTEGGKTLDLISHEKWFLLYIISDAISLFSSTTSVLMFLGILTSRYYEDAFLKSLPTKLIIGLSTLFFSIATMMIAFCSALYVMLQGQLTILIPVILLASVPVSLFVKLQFPLLVEIFVSTYGKGIFARRNDN